MEEARAQKRLQARIVNYADDLVICCRGQPEEALARMRDIMTKLKLTVNETKPRVCKLPGEKFDFLGYTFGRCYSPKTGRAYIGTVPSKKRVSRLCETIRAMTGRDQSLLDQRVVVAKLNRIMIGWANYFQLGLRPQTTYGIADSPVGLAAYFLDHDARSLDLISRVFQGQAEGLTRDDILDNITITWLTNTAISGARLYWGKFRPNRVFQCQRCQDPGCRERLR